MKRFLIPINTGLGNAILLFPLIKTIRHHFKHYEIDLYGDNSFGANCLYQYHDDINNIYTQFPSKKVDIVFNPFLGGGWMFALKMKLRNRNAIVVSHSAWRINVTSILKHIVAKLIGIRIIAIHRKKHESWNYLNLLSLIGVDESQCQWFDLVPKKMVDKMNASIIKFNLPQKYIAIQIGVANNQSDPRVWPLDHWKETIKQIVSDKITVVLLGDKNEMGLGQEIEAQHEGVINLIGKTSILELMGVINNAQLTVGVDSGIAHISGVLNKKTIVLWGPTIFSKSHPLGTNVHYINLNMPCSPCMGPGLYSPSDAIKNCKYSIACMNTISAEQVVNKIKQVLNENK